MDYMTKIKALKAIAWDANAHDDHETVKAAGDTALRILGSNELYQWWLDTLDDPDAPLPEIKKQEPTTTKYCILVMRRNTSILDCTIDKLSPVDAWLVEFPNEASEAELRDYLDRVTNAHSPKYEYGAVAYATPA